MIEVERFWNPKLIHRNTDQASGDAGRGGKMWRFGRRNPLIDRIYDLQRF